MKKKNSTSDELLENFKKEIVATRYGERTPQAAAAETRKFRALFDQAASPDDFFDIQGLYALHIAAGHGAYNLLKLFLEKGANPDVKFHGETLLHYSVNAPHNVRSAQILLERGANINALNNDERTPLERAVMHDDVKLAVFLLGKGADINRKGRWEQTPLHLAALAGADAAVAFLVQSCADTAARDDGGRTPFALSHTVQSAKIFLANGADINERNNAGESLLHWACRNPTTDIDLVEYLLSRGVHIDAKDNNGETPLHWAITYRSDAVPILLEAGADARIRTNEGTTCLDLARKRSSAGELLPLLQSAIDGALAQKREKRKWQVFNEKLKRLERFTVPRRKNNP